MVVSKTRKGTYGDSPFVCGSSRYFFTSLSQRKVFVRNIKGHVSQSSGYAACCHQHRLRTGLAVLTGSSSWNWRPSSSQSPPRSWRIPSAQPCRRHLNQRTRPAGSITGAFKSIPVAYLPGRDSPILSYQAALRRRSVEKPQGRVSLPRRQPFRDPPRTG
jgi:hypothetical protein